ncbi:MAG: PHP domain-containing protein [Agitococcus sp.]|nr:PHP domain-containing protein [Agitococcus sp.]
MPSVDLHCHSLYSDGSQSPQQLVEQAAAAGVTMLALTDHDSTNGLSEARRAAELAGIRLINGVEISAMWQKQLIHLVALNIDPETPILKAGLHEQQQARAKRGRLIAEKLENLGIENCWQNVLALVDNDENRVGRAHFAQYLVSIGRVKQLQQAFDKYLGNGKPAAVPMPWTDMQTAISWVKAAGGVTVLAHPARYGLSQTKLRLLLADFQQAGGQAMEVSTANEKPNVILNLAALANRFGLYASQGSDYHGINMPWLKLGKFAELPAGCQPVWEMF